MRRAQRGNSSRFLRRGQSERLRRSRRDRSARRTLFGMLFLVGAGMVLGAAYAGRHYALHSPRFRLRNYALAPTRHASQKELRAVLERHRGRNLFRVDIDRIARDMEAIRWVKSVRVKRVLPDRLLCAIEERQPRGLALLDGRVQIVDAEGAAIDTYGEETRMYSFPIFTGIDSADAGRTRVQVERGLALLEYMQRFHNGLVAEISEIDLSRDDRISLRLNGGGPVIRINPRDFGTNLDSYLTMRDYLGTHFGDGAYVDLRFPDRIAFRPETTRGR